MVHDVCTSSEGCTTIFTTFKHLTFSTLILQRLGNIYGRSSITTFVLPTGIEKLNKDPHGTKVVECDESCKSVIFISKRIVL